MPGGAAKQKFFTGAIVLQPAAALDAFVRIAAPGIEFVYAEAPVEPRDAECWGKARELAQTGLVRTHQRRRAGGGWQWYLVRTAKGLPRQVSPQQKVLGDRATAAIFARLKLAATLKQPCPSDTALAEHAGLSSRAQAQHRVRELIRVALIKSELAYERGVPTRVVTIVASKWAGTAADKFTALPAKWAALQAAAAREIPAEGNRA